MNEHYHKGLELAQKEEYQKAIEAFNRSLLLNPGHMECFYNRGMAKFRLERYLDAIQDFDQASNFAPSNADIFSQRGVAKHLIKRNDAALQDMNKSLALEPQNPYRYTSRAYIKAKMGDVLSAIDDYKIALKLDPEDAVAWNNLGMLEQSMGLHKSAKDRFYKADNIADEGQTFEKPTLDEILEEAREKEQSHISISVPEQEKQAGQESPAVQKESEPTGKEEDMASTPSFGAYLNIFKEVLSSKEAFADFWAFVKKDIFGKGKGGR